MEVLAIVSSFSFGKAAGLPHSGGRLPDRRLIPGMMAPRCNCSREGKEAGPPQEAGKGPLRGGFDRSKSVAEGNAPGLPQLAGRVPVLCKTCMKTTVVTVTT